MGDAEGSGVESGRKPSTEIKRQEMFDMSMDSSSETCFSVWSRDITHMATGG